ncbi:prepilin peptidase [Sneathiella marina]|uniref:Prepilin peptidase n=1 Tax=Sneathiella marina TaxID=2950108 RepID=A0ABY4W7X2_9PROT|nr:prepilin peptidase [Sneathiella marina]USG62941.1 prepilin peptidase [Sneathiella marina]
MILVYHLILLLLFTLITYAALSDLRDFTIPNFVSITIVILYPLMIMTSPDNIDWVGSLIVALSVLVIGFIFFSLRLFGAGDIKMIAALSLWAGPSLVTNFLFVTVIAGGLLVLLIISREGLRQAFEGTGFARGIRFAFQSKTQVPYGVAVAFGGMSILMSYEKIIGIST